MDYLWTGEPVYGQSGALTCTLASGGSALRSRVRKFGDPRWVDTLLADTAEKLRDRRKSRAIVLGNPTLARIRQRDVAVRAASLTEAITMLRPPPAGAKA
mgnify:CR=1 FL=1